MAEQYQALKQVIENWRELQITLQRMQVLSRELIFAPPTRLGASVSARKL